MRTPRSWDGCVAIPSAEIAFIVATFVFVIVIVIVGNVLKISGSDIAGILMGAGSLVGAGIGVVAARRPAGRSGPA